MCCESQSLAENSGVARIFGRMHKRGWGACCSPCGSGPKLYGEFQSKWRTSDIELQITSIRELFAQSIYYTNVGGRLKKLPSANKITVKKVRPKGAYSSTSEPRLRTTGRHLSHQPYATGSHSVTCHPTQVNAPRLNSARFCQAFNIYSSNSSIYSSKNVIKTAGLRGDSPPCLPDGSVSAATVRPSTHPPVCHTRSLRRKAVPIQLQFQNDRFSPIHAPMVGLQPTVSCKIFGNAPKLRN